MKIINGIIVIIIITTVSLASCKKLDRFPETSFSDANFWNTETDLIDAANRMYQQLDANWIDNRADDAVNQSGPNSISNGNITVPNTSADWSDRYDEIFTANNILEKAGRAKISGHYQQVLWRSAIFQSLRIFKPGAKVW